jgi:hypothetical protein
MIAARVAREVGPDRGKSTRHATRTPIRCCIDESCPPGGCPPGGHGLHLSRDGTRQQGSGTPLPDMGGATGRRLEPPLRASMEAYFGHDFGNVRIHDGSLAAQDAAGLHARAFTIGTDIGFALGSYQPGSRDGRRLIAHELAHVVQNQAVASSRVDIGVIPASSPTEAEADRIAERFDRGEIGLPISVHPPKGMIGRSPEKGATETSPPARAGQPRTAGGSAASYRPRPLNVDILGADMAVADPIVRAAAVAVGADLTVTSLDDMIGKLSSMAGPASGSCIRDLTIWNHGRPGAQIVAGGERVRTQGGRVVELLPTSAFDIEWLLASGNQSSLARLRRTFCCDATMHWNGCGTAGAEAPGGARTEAERGESALRYRSFGDRYKSLDEINAHGGTRLGATFGQVVVQTWADATCTTISAATDFTYIGPGDRTRLARVGHGGQSVTTRPAGNQCACEEASGRPVGTWTLESGRRAAAEAEQAIVGGDYLWHLHLRLFREVMGFRNAAFYREQRARALLQLISDAAERTPIPGSLPVGDLHPWINVDTLDPTYAAVTMPHLALCFPNNCWRWFLFNQKAIQATPDFTRMVLGHELMHAADVWRAALAFRRANGEPPEGAGNRCSPVAEGVRRGWTDPWGRYVNSFIEFYEGGLSPTRHEEIYAESAGPVFERLTTQERLEWFAGAIQNIPADLPPGDRIAPEDRLAVLFVSPDPDTSLLAFRQEAAAQLLRTTEVFTLGDSRGQGIDLARARSLLNHFLPIWRLRPEQRTLLLQAVRNASRVN